jgi:hypothetical protein
MFQIEQYEICSSTYRVEAASEAEAIAKLLDGDGELVDGSHEYVETAEDCGLSADEYPQLAEELRQMDVPVEEIIPSIRSVKRIE